ncbi:MAG: hypothetical protein ACHQJX_09410 [Candidatus Acidiferrales bacterium]
MRQIILALLSLISLSAIAHAQKAPPQLLIRAAHCLAVKNFLPSSRAASRTFGYFLDEKSYPGQKVVYVVNYREPARSNGWVFTIVLTEHDGHQHFNIQNNARFVLSKDEPIGVSFVDPPLGGTWTQQHIAMAIKRIETRARFTLDSKDLLAASSATCEAYTDPQASHF